MLRGRHWHWHWHVLGSVFPSARRTWCLSPAFCSQEGREKARHWNNQLLGLLLALVVACGQSGLLQGLRWWLFGQLEPYAALGPFASELLCLIFFLRKFPVYIPRWGSSGKGTNIDLRGRDECAPAGTSHTGAEEILQREAGADGKQHVLTAALRQPYAGPCPAICKKYVRSKFRRWVCNILLFAMANGKVNSLSGEILEDCESVCDCGLSTHARCHHQK